MRVKIEKNFAQHTKGDVIEVHPGIAKIWISAGRAQSMSQPTKPVQERAVAPTYEKR
jgi:hypothetical protein